MKQISRIQPKRILGAKMSVSPLFFVMVALLALTLSPAPAFAGIAEAKAAYDAKDYETAFKEYLPLAEAGNAKAQNKIGLMYRYGLGRKVDYIKAIYWFSKVANNGNASVLISLGFMAGKGQGMKLSKKSENCFNRIASIRGYPTAQWNLFLSLDRSIFSANEAWEWLERAVKQGQPAAMARYGAALYENPIREKTDGLMYLWLSHINGNDPDVLAYINKKVGTNRTRIKQLEKAKQLADKWKPVKEIPPTDLPPYNFKKCFP